MPGDVVIEDQGLTKPATVLIERISDAVGGIARPHQIVRVAKAEAKANRIRTESEIELEDLRFRAASRFVEEETRKQLNMESITRKALPHLADDASPGDMEDDWLTNFFDKSRILSDEEMQEVWARILAGEANTPGRFSRKTINILSDLDKADAGHFSSLCSNIWYINGEETVVIFPDERTYDEMGLTSEVLGDLESLGLIIVSNSDLKITAYSEPHTVDATYFARKLRIALPGIGEDMFTISRGRVLLTRAGHQLASICETAPAEGVYEFVCARWGGSGYGNTVTDLSGSV